METRFPTLSSALSDAAECLAFFLVNVFPVGPLTSRVAIYGGLTDRTSSQWLFSTGKAKTPVAQSTHPRSIW